MPIPAAKQGGRGVIMLWSASMTEIPLYDAVSLEYLRQGKVPITCRLRHVSTSKGCDLVGHKVIRIFAIMTVVHVLIRFGIAQEY